MPDCTVTVVIPCFNHGQFVQEAVDSVLGQTYRDLRAIVVDDGSTDPHTIGVLHALPGPRVEVLHRENGHLSAARNTGIQSSTSKYIVTLDADDYFEPTFVEKSVDIAEADESVGAVTCGIRLFGVRHGNLFSSGGTVMEFLPRNCARASALFPRRCWEKVGGYDETMKRGYEDWDFWIRIAACGLRIHAIPEALLNYRCAKQSMVTGSDAIRPELVRELTLKHLPLYREHVVDVLHEKECMIQSLEERLDQLRGSTAYRVGRCICEPFTVIRAALRRGLDRCS